MKFLINSTLILTIALGLTIALPTLAIAKDASDSERGTIIVKLDPKTRGVKYAKKLLLGTVLGDSLVFYRFEGDEAEALTGNAKGKGSKKKMPIYKTDDGYLSMDVKPGRYFLSTVIHQTHWGSCLNDKTILFDVEPNSATHIGTVDVSRTVSGIKSGARTFGHFKVKETDGLKHIYVETNSPPKITPPNDTDLQNGTEVLRIKNPDFTGPVITGNIRPFKFKKKVKKVKQVGDYTLGTVLKCGK